MTFYIILGLSSFMIVLLGTRLTILAMRKRTVLPAYPGDPRAHIPSGGIAVVFALIICLAIADIHYGLILGLLLLAAVALLNDLIQVPTPIRLLVQILAVAVALSTFAAPIFSPDIPGWLDKTMAGILWIGFFHLFHRMDTIDGLAAVEMTCIATGLCLISVFMGHFPDTLSGYGLIVAAAGCGFGWWNWYPARVRLGDAGSIPIGFLLGYLLLHAVAAGYVYVALILPAYLIADGGISTIAWLRRKTSAQTSPDYYYRKALRNGRKPSSVVRYILGINLLLIFLAVNSVINPDIAVFFNLVLAYLAVFMLMGFFSHTGPQHHEPF